MTSADDDLLLGSQGRGIAGAFSDPERHQALRDSEMFAERGEAFAELLTDTCERGRRHAHRRGNTSHHGVDLRTVVGVTECFLIV